MTYIIQRWRITNNDDALQTNVFYHALLYRATDIFQLYVNGVW